MSEPLPALTLPVVPLSGDAFARFGNVLEIAGPPTRLINAGRCGRYHDLADIDIDTTGSVGISLFAGTPYELPLALTLMERHPLGSQAFVPMSTDPFLIVVAEDEDARPVRLQAFASNGHQGVNYRRNTWHAVLTPVGRNASFAVIDRIGPGENLEEYHFEVPPQVVDPGGLLSPAATRAG